MLHTCGCGADTGAVGAKERAAAAVDSIAKGKAEHILQQLDDVKLAHFIYHRRAREA